MVVLPDSILPLGYALAIGLLIGLERGWALREDAPGTRVAGFRTFGILGLIGGVAGLMPPLIAAAALVVAGALLLMGYVRRSAHADGLSATNALAALLTMALGLLATTGRPTVALAVAAAATLLLSMRRTLHRWLEGLSEAEIRSSMRFAIIALVILPLAPDRAMGPLEAWNPHQLWLVVVLVSGLSFAGYIATRRIGPARGALVTAACGALVSSTAVTAAFARRLGAGEQPAGPLIGGIALASLVMFVRVLLLAGMLAPYALPSLTMLMVPALLVAVVTAAMMMRGVTFGRSADAAMTLGNPLDLKAALGLAFLVALISLATRWALERFGDAGVGILLALTGLADVDAAVLSLAGLPPGTLDARSAGIILAGPVLLNTLVKAALALFFAPGRAGVRAAAPLVASVLASAVAAAFVLL